MIKTEPWTGGTDEEYETQHFGFGSQRFKISVRQMVEQKITNCVKDLESSLQESLQLNDTDKATMERCSNKLIRLYCEKAEPSLEVIDNEIEKIMRVPANVLLSSDECQLKQYSDAEYEKLKEDVASLKKRVERGALMEALLTAEVEELSAMDKLCETAKKDMEIFDILNNETDIKTTINETMFLCASANIKEKDGYEIFD